MYYCFVEEDIRELDTRDPLMLQLDYAKVIGKNLCCHIAEGVVKDSQGCVVDVKGEKLFLRSAYNTMFPAIELLEKLGAILVENLDDIEQIESWSRHNITERFICIVRAEEIIKNNFSADARRVLESCEVAFLKTLKKGFSAKVAVRKLWEQDTEVTCLLNSKCKNMGEVLFLTESLAMGKDSLGKKEVRLVVLNGRIHNASRMVHSVKHNIPPKWLAVAGKFVERLAEIKAFPMNYIMDIGEFTKDGQKFWDIVELNPITSSMCYVNNTIFEQYTDDIKEWYNRTGMGCEYCYDALIHPESYVMQRAANKSYEYTSESHYTFL